MNDLRNLYRALLFFIFCLLTPPCLEAERLTVKMATLAPTGSPWHELLIEMGQEWQRVTDGDVILRIYPDGVAGDERDIIRKIRIGQLHAAAITSEGLSEISWDMNVFYIPLLFESLEELDAIRDELNPYLAVELKKMDSKFWDGLMLDGPTGLQGSPFTHLQTYKKSDSSTG